MDKKGWMCWSTGPSGTAFTESGTLSSFDIFRKSGELDLIHYGRDLSPQGFQGPPLQGKNQ